MPPVRARLIVLAGLLTLAALTFSGIALAGNGGFAPPGPDSPNGARIESIYWTAKDILSLERHGARTLRGLRVRIAVRFLALAAAISLNHELGRPSRALVDYVA